jgi:uncharacterized damage-inducible protein DinB
MIDRHGADSPPAEASLGVDNTEQDAERSELSEFLTAQRQSVLAIVEGLDEAALRQAVVPSGWTPLGMLEHLAYAERFWFQHSVTGLVGDLPWPTSEADEEDLPFASDHPVAAVLAFYRDQCARSDAVLSSVTLNAEPRGGIPSDMADLARNVRTIVLHMIEETARHAGHLDIARELIDGRTGLGPR